MRKSVLLTVSLVGCIGCAAQSRAVQSRPAQLTDTASIGADASVVEYVKVEGQPCLQPKMIAGTPEDADLVRAQYRWLAKTYPGYRLVQQSHVLTLARELRPPGDEDDQGPGEHDSLQFETADGKPISVCFSLTPPALTGK